MTTRFDEGMVLTWSGRWHWPDPGLPRRQASPSIPTLCKNWAYDEATLPKLPWIQFAARDATTPICKKCAKKVAKDDD